MPVCKMQILQEARKPKRKERDQWQPLNQGVSIPYSDQACNDQVRLSRIIGVVYLGSEEPTIEVMKQSLCSISASFSVFDWHFVKWRIQYLLRFLTAEGLDHVVRRTSIPCKDRKAGFMVYK